MEIILETKGKIAERWLRYEGEDKFTITELDRQRNVIYKAIFTKGEIPNIRNSEYELAKLNQNFWAIRIK